MSFLAMDEPRHGRMRRLVRKGFTPRRVLDLEPRVRAITDEHLAPALEQWRVRLHRGRCRQGPDGRRLGAARRPRPPTAPSCVASPMSSCIARTASSTYPPAAATASIDLAVYYLDLIAERRRAPRDDLTSALLDVELDGERLTDDELGGVPVPDGRRGQRDDDEAARPLLVLGLAQPRAAREAACATAPRCRPGSRRRCATTPRARCSPAPRRPTSRCTAESIPAGARVLAAGRRRQP